MYPRFDHRKTDGHVCEALVVYEPEIAEAAYRDQFQRYVSETTTNPLLLLGDALHVLRDLPDNSVDFCMTSPPYWGKREYHDGGIGLEERYEDYISHLLAIFGEVRRVLKVSGSFWLNIGDSYLDKRLLGIPWRVAFKLTDQQGWILRNSVIWNKVKGGPDNSLDRLRNVHEDVFHFVRSAHGYYYDADAIRSNPKKTRVVNGAIVSATGVTGVRYRRQIELSTALSEQEKQAALHALEKMLASIQRGDVADFRMIIRGQQRTTHSDSESVSGRAREIAERGFYFLKYHPNGSKPSDVWDILPEDTQNRDAHFAPYPEDLCRIPIAATCPATGIVLDPFCGTGTTLLAAKHLGRRSVGIDTSRRYLRIAEERCRSLL
jgi:site-specific DNA-methyltransferase (adenine-specific)